MITDQWKNKITLITVFVILLWFLTFMFYNSNNGNYVRTSQSVSMRGVVNNISRNQKELNSNRTHISSGSTNTKVAINLTQISDTEINHMTEVEIYDRNRNDKIELAKKVVIFTSYRSGSSFVGEVFKHFPNTFYSFEPLMFLRFTQKDNLITNVLLRKNVSYFLKNIMDCNFKPLKTSSEKYLSTYSTQRKHWIPRAFPGSGTFESAMQQCNRKLNIVTKVIRAKYLEDVVKLLQQNITIVHLIRDPRGTISSRMKISTSKRNIESHLRAPKNLNRQFLHAKKHCKRLQINLKYVINTINKLDTKLLSRFLVIRYEDFAHFPKAQTLRLFKHFGMVPTDAVLNWLHTITTVDSTNVWGVKRDSEQTVNGWRTYLPYSFVQIIQEQCETVLKGYGYKLLNTKKELLDLSHSVLDNFPSNLHQILS